jgi:hypothetical protein
MRAANAYSEALFSKARLGESVPATPPLRSIHQWNNEALAKMDEKFSAIHEANVKDGRPSIAPEKLMRAMRAAPASGSVCPGLGRHALSGAGGPAIEGGGRLGRPMGARGGRGRVCPDRQFKLSY